MGPNSGSYQNLGYSFKNLKANGSTWRNTPLHQHKNRNNVFNTLIYNDSVSKESIAERQEIASRESEFQFYQPNPDKYKRLETPGYAGLEAY